jgi:hypothetical protein
VAPEILWGDGVIQSGRQRRDASEDERGDSFVFFHLRYEVFAIVLNSVRTDLLGFVQKVTEYCVGDKMEKMRWAGHVARMGEEKGGA